MLEVVREEAASRHSDVIEAATVPLERYKYGELRDAVLDMMKLYRASQLPAATFQNTVLRMRNVISQIMPEVEGEEMAIMRVIELDRAIEDCMAEFRKGPKIIFSPSQKIILPN